jgi:hypothetical protein
MKLGHGAISPDIFMTMRASKVVTPAILEASECQALITGTQQHGHRHQNLVSIKVWPEVMAGKQRPELIKANKELLQFIVFCLSLICP